MPVTRSIRKKILTLVIFVSMLGFFVLGVTSVFSMYHMRNEIITGSNALGKTAANDSSEALEKKVKDELMTLSKGIAAISDEKLQTIENQTMMIANVASNIYSNPGLYSSEQSTVDYLQPSQVGTFTLHIKTAEGVEKADIQEELNLASNLSDLLCQVNELDLSINASYIGTETGFQLSADKDPQGPNNHSFPVTERSWYTGAVAANGIYWTEVFVDASANRTSINCSIPFYDTSGETPVLKGVAVSAATLDQIKNIISTSGVGETGYSFIVDQQGNVIITDKEMLVKDGEVVYQNLLEEDDAVIRTAAQDMIQGNSGIVQARLNGRDVLLAYSPLSVMPWSMATVVEVEEVLAPSEAISTEISTLTRQTVNGLSRSINSAIAVFAVLLLAMTALILVLSFRFSKKITDPVESLMQSVKTISGGNLNIKIDKIHTGDEIEALADAFEKMTYDLRSYIENLAAVTAEKERIGAELNVATQIQASMLPCIFPAFPGRKEFDIYATMQPAKEVGGDFYDFFLVDDNHLALVMADVSGKGVPAALFMVIAKTLLKNSAQNGLSPQEVLKKVNNQLCENNDAEMFVTVWLGIYEISTGKLTAANAGHEYPAVKRADGSFELIRDKHGFVLAGMEGAKYTEYELFLNKGDALFVYTDGVAEATDANETLYGTDRMLAALNDGEADEPKELLRRVKADIDRFVGEAPQFDDITMLGLKIWEREE